VRVGGADLPSARVPHRVLSSCRRGLDPSETAFHPDSPDARTSGYRQRRNARRLSRSRRHRVVVLPPRPRSPTSPTRTTARDTRTLGLGSPVRPSLVAVRDHPERRGLPASGRPALTGTHLGGAGSGLASVVAQCAGSQARRTERECDGTTARRHDGRLVERRPPASRHGDVRGSVASRSSPRRPGPGRAVGGRTSGGRPPSSQPVARQWESRQHLSDTGIRACPLVTARPDLRPPRC
jgi:hypothetical protein